MNRERRKHKRINIDIDLIAHLKGDTGSELYQSFVKNISDGGVCIILDKEIKPETNVHINFHIPEMMLKPIEVSGKTMWKKQIENEKGYAHGVMFTDVPEKDKAIIENVISLIYDLRKTEST